MKVERTIKWVLIALPFIAAITIASCKKNESSNTGQSQIQIRLIDNPPGNDVKEVWVDIQQVEIMMSDSSKPLLLTGVHPGVYNLLALTNGKDTLLADAMIPAGTISQIRLILGDNNYVITGAGDKIALKTPSAQQSGLKVQIHEAVSGWVLYRLTLDFDVARSIVKAGNSGQYILKPVLRIMSFAPSGGNIRGVVVPDSVLTAVFAIQGTDTIASTFTNTMNGNYFIKDVAAGTYSLSFVPSDTTYKTAMKNATVVLGQTTAVDTVKLVH